MEAFSFGLGIFLLLLGIPTLLVAVFGLIEFVRDEELTGVRLFTGCGVFVIGAALVAFGIPLVVFGVGVL